MHWYTRDKWWIHYYNTWDSTADRGSCCSPYWVFDWLGLPGLGFDWPGLPGLGFDWLGLTDLGQSVAPLFNNSGAVDTDAADDLDAASGRWIEEVIRPGECERWLRYRVSTTILQKNISWCVIEVMQKLLRIYTPSNKSLICLTKCSFVLRYMWQCLSEYVIVHVHWYFLWRKNYEYSVIVSLVSG